MRRAFLTFCVGDESYYLLGSKLTSEFLKRDFDVFVLTDNDKYFQPNVNILHHNKRFSYHDKVLGLQSLYERGYEKIVYMDSDIIINDVNGFFTYIDKFKFEPGITYTRGSIDGNLDSYLFGEGRKKLKENLSQFNLELDKIPSVYEDVLFFNTKTENVQKFFDFFNIISGIKHQFDEDTKWWRYGDQEGYSISIATKLSNCPLHCDGYNIINFLRATNRTYDGRMKTITSDVDFIFPYRFDSEDRRNNLKTCIEYYRNHFPDNKFIISEQGDVQTIAPNGFDYVFFQKPLPHNQSKCINDGIKKSTAKVIVVVDSDIILINHENIHSCVKNILMDKLDYCLPYMDCIDLPNFEYRKPWGTNCIGGIFLIDRQKFIEVGMNNERFEGWGREDDERHQRLLKSNFKFKREYGTIVHMYHPHQSNIDSSAEINLGLLNSNKNDNSNINQI